MTDDWLDDLKLTWRDRLRDWLERKFKRQRCDGCHTNFRINRITPVSGDCWLCDPCFRRWYPEFCEKPAATPDTERSGG